MSKLLLLNYIPQLLVLFKFHLPAGLSRNSLHYVRPLRERFSVRMLYTQECLRWRTVLGMFWTYTLDQLSKVRHSFVYQIKFHNESDSVE